MKTMSVAEFKNHFSEIIKQAKADESIAVTYGKKKEIIGYFHPVNVKKPKRILGILEGKATFTFAPDFKITDDEFLAL